MGCCRTPAADVAHAIVICRGHARQGVLFAESFQPDTQERHRIDC